MSVGPSSPQAIEVALPGHSEQIPAMTSVNGLAPLKSSFVSPVIFVQRRLMSR